MKQHWLRAATLLVAILMLALCLVGCGGEAGPRGPKVPRENRESRASKGNRESREKKGKRVIPAQRASRRMTSRWSRAILVQPMNGWIP